MVAIIMLLPPSLRLYSPYPRCYLKLGDWRTQLDERHMTSSTIATVLQFFQKSTEYDRSWYKAWHSWAYMNFQALLEQKLLNTANALDSNGNNYCQYVSIAVLNACMPLIIAVLKAVSSPENVALQDSATRSHEPSPTPPSLEVSTITYACSAVHGFFRSIALSVENSLQDTLRYNFTNYNIVAQHEILQVKHCKPVSCIYDSFPWHIGSVSSQWNLR